MSARFASGVAIGLAAILTVAAIPSAQAQGFGFATFTAVVKSNGKTERSSGVKKSSRTGTGQYAVTFMRTVKNCAYVASPQGKNGGQASVSIVNGKKLRVDTFSKNGVHADLAFVLLVSCI